jgi:hypothetical protein
MLDFLSDDIKQLRNRVPSAEQDKLSHYLLAFEEPPRTTPEAAHYDRGYP